MKDPRNPFRMRASEQIASETTFLKLFGPGVLEILPPGALEQRPVVFRSAPGGGKTSLLRVFTPSALVTLFANRANDDFKDLFVRMKEIGAVDDNGPQLLAAMLSCTKNYAPLEDFTRDKGQAERLFFALLDSRVLLAFLHGALVMRNLEYPADLNRISLRIEPDIAARLGLLSECPGPVAYEWARNIETAIGQALDSLDLEPPSAPGHQGLLLLEGLRSDGLMIDGKPIVQKLLVMFDDVHKLAPQQRMSLGQSLTRDRGGVPAWLAERLEAMTSDELLELGSRHGRDYDDQAPTLEKYWRDHSSRFEKSVMNIADKRVREARSVEIDSFVGCLEGSIEGPEHQAILEQALATVSMRVQKTFDLDPRFREWAPLIKQTNTTTLERLLDWRTLEVVLARPPRKQLSLELAVPDDQSVKMGDDAGLRSSAVRAAADLFLSAEFHLPYYYSFERLVSLASYNIEQFLAISGDIFEEASSYAILRKNHQLSPERQHSILKKAAENWWEQDLLRAIPMRTEVRSFVESIGRFARWETAKANAPYPPGVTGIAITMADRDRLRDPKVLENRPDLQQLASVLAICLAYNIMDAQLDRSQNYERRMVLYLNRLLCARFDLPLQYGGWRPKKPEDLAKWVKEGFRPPSGETLI
ncbi:MAG: hypothetical protein Q7R50_08665 [Dehalococcoidales bacterium]|nr:hypothetical protein [Dehalococcoidales bacterium]